MEHVATEHFWMSGMYWGLTAMALLGRLGDMDLPAITTWVLSCQKPDGGFGGSPRNDSHLLYTLSAVQILALTDQLDLVNADAVVDCEWQLGERVVRRRQQQAGDPGTVLHVLAAGCCQCGGAQHTGTAAGGSAATAGTHM
jgi:geranylgeranyl transferase type-2 subunit beta